MPLQRARIAGRHVAVSHVHATKVEAHVTAARLVEVQALHMQIREAMRKYPERAPDSAAAEMKEMLDREVFVPLHPSDATRKELKKIVKTFLFFKEKFNRDGILECLKGRLVAVDNSYESSLNPDKNSPTVRLESIMMVIGSLRQRAGSALAWTSGMCTLKQRCPVRR